MRQPELRAFTTASDFAAVAFAAVAAALPATALAQQTKENTVRIGRDNTVVSESCTVEPPAFVIPDVDNDGVLQIKGRTDGTRIVVDLGGNMMIGGAGTPERMNGIGIAISGPNVTLRHGKLKGFKVAISAKDCDQILQSKDRFIGDDWDPQLFQFVHTLKISSGNRLFEECRLIRAHQLHG